MADVGSTPQLEAPVLAELYQKMTSRAPWQASEPLEVDPDTFSKAVTEMRDVQERQGRSVPKAAWLKQENFLLRGIPVVISNDL